jgi:hypothetical protein
MRHEGGPINKKRSIRKNACLEKVEPDLLGTQSSLVENRLSRPSVYLRFGLGLGCFRVSVRVRQEREPYAYP